jgi:hypothetical protein
MIDDWSALARLRQRSGIRGRFVEHIMNRSIAEVRVIPLHGTTAVRCVTIKEAVEFLASYNEADACLPLLNYEVQIRYDNDDKIDARFGEKASAIEFLEYYGNGN